MPSKPRAPRASSYGRDPAMLPKEITDHDRERAEHTVRRLEEL